MALHGDFHSYPLPELLQWMDVSRKKGTLLLRWQGVERKLYLNDGRLVATAAEGLWERFARILSVARIAAGEDVLGAFRWVRARKPVAEAFANRNVQLSHLSALALDELTGTLADLTTQADGEFHWSEELDWIDEEWVGLDVGVRQLLFETLRWVDEQADVDRVLNDDGILLQAKANVGKVFSPLSRAVLAVAERVVALGNLRLALGVTRSTASRKVYDLMKLEQLDVQGAGQISADPVAQLLEKGLVLVREQQFEAAGLVFASLLTSDPTDRRVREFARMVEREHVGALYQELPPLYVPRLTGEVQSLAMLRPEERRVSSLVNGTWDVSTIVLASHTTELETLKALSKMRKLGLFEG